MLHILAISGSLRAASINTAFLRAVARSVPNDVRLITYDGLGNLPLFNPDLEPAPPQLAVTWREHVAQADGLLIASPEYAHGVTGAIKNALDWLVSDVRFVNKPVAVVNTSPRAHHADAALRETLMTMNADLIGDASITVPLLGANLDLDCLAQTEVVKTACDTIVQALRAAVTKGA